MIRIRITLRLLWYRWLSLQWRSAGALCSCYMLPSAPHFRSNFVWGTHPKPQGFVRYSAARPSLLSGSDFQIRYEWFNQLFLVKSAGDE